MTDHLSEPASDAASEPADDLGSFLDREANTDRWGGTALAHLRRADEEEWYFLVVARNNLPLHFWSVVDTYSADGEVTNEEGRTLMVLVSTPPGVTPSGLIAVPADAHGSPKGRLVSIVQADDMVMIGSPGAPPSEKGPQEIGASMLQKLLTSCAKRSDSSYYTTELDAAGGGTVPVIVDWDGRPLMFWIDVPADEPEESPIRTLYAAAVTDQGIVAVQLNLSLQSTMSGDQLLLP